VAGELFEAGDVTPATPGLPEWRVTRLSKPARGVDEFFPNVNDFTVLDRFRIYFMKVR
jgi:hypothetical protein